MNKLKSSMNTMRQYGLLGLLLTASILLCGCLGSWWWMLIPTILLGAWFVGEKPYAMFVAGFAIGSLVWGLAGWYYGMRPGTLPGMIAELFSLPSAAALGWIVASLGGLLVGFSALFGAYLRKVISG